MHFISVKLCDPDNYRDSVKLCVSFFNCLNKLHRDPLRRHRETQRVID